MMTNTQKQSIRELRRMGLAYSTIADATGLSANTVKSFCHRNNVGTVSPISNYNPDTCKYCGDPLKHHPGKRKKCFCNDKCRSDWWNCNRRWLHRKKASQLICYYCGTEFNSYGNKKRKYCGRDCYIRSRYGEGLP